MKFSSTYAFLSLAYVLGRGLAHDMSSPETHLWKGTAVHDSSTKHCSSWNQRQSLSTLRGGDLGPVSSTTLAKIFGGLASCDALGGALAPRTSMKWFGVDIEANSLPEHYLHGIGASAATTAVSTYLAVSKAVSVEEAIGYGFVARLVSMTLMLVTNRYHELGMNNVMFGTMWMILAGTIYALFAGVEDALLWTKLVSLLLAFHGIFLYAKPEKFLKRAAETFDRDSLTLKMASIDGAYMMMSGVVTCLLADQMDPARVTGFAALSFVPALFKLMDVVEVDQFFGIDTGVLTMVLIIGMSAIIVGTLH